MTSSPELLRFFHSEAGEYLDAIEGLLAQSDAGLDAGAFVAASRAMRGTATMARAPRVADIALVLEQIGNAVRDGELTWSVALLEELRDAVSDLRLLVAAAAAWTPAEDQRASQRLAGLQRFAPNDYRRPTPPAPAASTAPIFIALQAAAIAADLDSFVADPRNRSLLDDVISRVRSLRGIAGVAEHPPLNDVSDAVERCLREMSPDALLADADNELLRAAAAVFRRASADLRARGRINLASGEIARFARAAAPAPATAADRESVVRIDDLFYADSGPHLVERGQASETSETRLRAEMITHAEHLRRLIADARSAIDPVSRDRAGRDLRQLLARLESLARSFNAQQAAAFFGDLHRRASPGDPTVLDIADAGAQAVLAPNASVQEMEQRLAMLDRRASALPVQPSPATVRAPTPPTGPTASSATPRSVTGASGKALHEMLESGLAGLRPLENEPLSAPARLDDDHIVPVESLLYRGRSALNRAVEIRDAFRTSGAVNEELLQELYDLLDLARAE